MRVISIDLAHHTWKQDTRTRLTKRASYGSWISSFTQSLLVELSLPSCGLSSKTKNLLVGMSLTRFILRCSVFSLSSILVHPKYVSQALRTNRHRLARVIYCFQGWRMNYQRSVFKSTFSMLSTLSTFNVIQHESPHKEIIHKPHVSVLWIDMI